MRTFFQTVDTICMYLFFMLCSTNIVIAIIGIWKWELIWLKIFGTNIFGALLVVAIGMLCEKLDKK
jgi:hypothetical protein